jgi:hypothetical protein
MLSDNRIKYLWDSMDRSDLDYVDHPNSSIETARLRFARRIEQYIYDIKGLKLDEEKE